MGIEDRKGLQLLDRFDIKLVGAVSAAPSGDWLVYQRLQADIETDTTKARLWRVNTDGSGHGPLQDGSGLQTCARFSPDGRQLAWLDSSSGSLQVHTMDCDSGGGGQLTRGLRSPSMLSWSPCAEWLAFYAEVDLPVEPFAQITTRPNWSAPPQITQAALYKMDGRGWLPHASRQLFVVNVQDGTPLQLTNYSQDVHHFLYQQGPEWLPDSSGILFVANPEGDPISESRKINVHSVNLDGTVTPLTDMDGSCLAVSASPDGRWLAISAAIQDRTCSPLYSPYLLDRQSGDLIRLCADLDLSVAEALDNDGRPLTWDADSESFYAMADDRGETRLLRFYRDGRREVVIDFLCQGSSGYGMGAAWGLLRNGGIVFGRGRAAEWPELFVRDVDGSERCLTMMNERLRRTRALADCQELQFTNPEDGQALQGWLYTPPNFDAEKKYPLILEIHGGPHGNFGPRFWPRLQTMAAAGYCVLMMNPRGSTSYGHDFARGIEQGYPDKDVGDLLAGVDEACQREFVDSNALFVTGISGGGTLTTALVAATDRFRAAAALCPFVDGASLRLGADVSDFIQYMFQGMPWEVPEHYQRHSTLYQVGRVSTPTMLQGGDMDLRTPFAHAEMYYQALRYRGIDTVLVRFGDENHGTSARPSHGMQSIELVLNWFAKYRD